MKTSSSLTNSHSAIILLIRNGAKRLGLINVYTYLSDASIFNENYGMADRVLCDVPCSGLGIIRRKPEIRFKKAADIDNLPELQYRILCNATRYLKEGGRLVYSTCTLNPKENEGVCNRFLAEHPEFEAVEVLPTSDKSPSALAAAASIRIILPHSSTGICM